jgi:hypothetical protein
MSDVVLQELVVRMATDAAFADRVRSAPAQTLGAFDLTPEEVAQLSSLGADAGATSEGLAARQSKSSLFFMGAHHVEHGAIGHTGFHDPGAPHVNLHDPGTLHGAQTHSSVGPQSHMDGDGAVMLTDTHEGGGGRHDLFQGGGHSNSMDGDGAVMLTDTHEGGGGRHDLFQGGGHSNSMDGDGAVMLTDTHEGGGGRHDLFTGGVHPGTGENVQVHGSGPVESPEKQIG